MRLSLLCLLALAGCATQATAPELRTAAQPQGAAWTFRAPSEAALDASSRDGHPESALSDVSAPAAWWSLFDDPVLTQLQAEAVDGSLDLQTALTRIDESQAHLGLTRASGEPRLSGRTGYTRAAISADSPLAMLGVPTTPYNEWQLGLQASWELDLWGYRKHLTDAARAQLDATRWAAGAARVTLAAEVARHYLMLRGVQAQQRLVADHRRIAAELLRLTESRERNGVATQFDSAAARAELATVEARGLQFEHQRDALMNALALLLGQPPHQLDERLVPNTAMPQAPARLPVGVPSELARRRPDILQAEALLQAATADLGAAQADFYPRVSLTAGLGLVTSKLNELTHWDMRHFSVGPVVYLPIFDGGQLQRTLDLTEARQRSAAIAWRQVVLRAWHEVTDALDSCASEQARQAKLQQAAASNEAALSSARNAWKAGTAEFTTVLVAQRSLLNAQAALADNATSAGLAVVSLYRALGGGTGVTP
jgi:NodT family efflux transporter outer membrane factor (OMF) lipoprotein